jgi:hypothetical protein
MLPEWHSEDVTVHLVFPTQRAMRPAVRVLVDEIVAYFDAAKNRQGMPALPLRQRSVDAEGTEHLAQDATASDKLLKDPGYLAVIFGRWGREPPTSQLVEDHRMHPWRKSRLKRSSSGSTRMGTIYGAKTWSRCLIHFG